MFDDVAIQYHAPNQYPVRSSSNVGKKLSLRRVRVDIQNDNCSNSVGNSRPVLQDAPGHHVSGSRIYCSPFEWSYNIILRSEQLTLIEPVVAARSWFDATSKNEFRVTFEVPQFKDGYRTTPFGNMGGSLKWHCVL
jgi:hypothetical protein